MKSVLQHIEEVDGLVALVESMLNDAVRVEAESIPLQLEQVHAILNNVVDDFNTVSIPLLVFECCSVRVFFAGFEVEERMHFDLKEDGLPTTCPDDWSAC